ncbi:hypothetical protein [Spongiactinospora sp. TRM90649]|uniref:hypothetical protein n=1 Tax=Spongiactinospora sp. TRM90649 TaxID=3031114 RepID=UPI0023F8A595|nr:hypothetical protein [Spongiactinospora sp. TRM90649]MDF5759163.1 hypothetical protein [Spongiactinospora sp. TRM90649]
MRRYRFGRAAAVIVGLYLVFVAVASALELRRGRYWPDWAKIAWAESDEGFTSPLLFAAAVVLMAWMFWQIFHGPLVVAEPAGRPEKAVVWLRRVLYFAVVGELILLEVADDLYDPAEPLLALLTWGALVGLFARVLDRAPRPLRAITLVFGVLYTATPLLWLVDEFTGFELDIDLRLLLGVATLVWTALILWAQRADGRWSAGTVWIGWLALVAPPLLRLLPDAYSDPGWMIGPSRFSSWVVIIEALDLLTAVWLARSAHELAHPRGAVTPRAGLPRTLKAVWVLIPALFAVQAEETPRFTYTGMDDGCFAWTAEHRPYGDTRPEDRERAFLCHARSTMDGMDPSFPDEVPDQRILAYGRALCAARDVEAEQALPPAPGGGRRSRAYDASRLVFLCPEIIGAEQPGLLRGSAQVRQDTRDFIAEENARCADPWPRVRAHRQGTVAYFLGEGGGYYIYDDKTDVEDTGESDTRDRKDGFMEVTETGAVVETWIENEPLCVTAKAFRSAPPLRAKGWALVSEVGVRSRSGRLAVPQSGELGGPSATELPNLAAAGPGRYRVRLYVRDDGEHPIEHLIVTYPGRSDKRVILSK